MKKEWLFNIILSVIIFLIIVSAIAIGVMFYYINTINNFTEMRNLANKYEADIQVELQMRFDKVPNLVEIVQSAAKHEEEIIKSITEAREQYNAAVTSGDTAKMLEANTAINAACTKFAEEYPEIAAMELYGDLMDEYSGIEAAIAVARRNYNEVVMKYNNMIEHMPSAIIAQKGGFERISEFKAVEAANNAFEINM